tara:strand:- start:272 stop:508 length:237 start_codon:yes stop_codon:yes gene_type:complete
MVDQVVEQVMEKVVLVEMEDQEILLLLVQFKVILVEQLVKDNQDSLLMELVELVVELWLQERVFLQIVELVQQELMEV